MIMAEQATRKVPAHDEESAAVADPVAEPNDTVLVRRACEGDLGAYDDWCVAIRTASIRPFTT